MKVYCNGTVRDMTPAELAAMEAERVNMPAPAPEPATEDRLAALEAAVLALMGGGADA